MRIVPAEELTQKVLEMHRTGRVNGVPWHVHRARKTEYHRRKLELWERGMPDHQYVKSCIQLRKELGL